MVIQAILDGVIEEPRGTTVNVTFYNTVSGEQFTTRYHLEPELFPTRKSIRDFIKSECERIHSHEEARKKVGDYIGAVITQFPEHGAQPTERFGIGFVLSLNGVIVTGFHNDVRISDEIDVRLV